VSVVNYDTPARDELRERILARAALSLLVPCDHLDRRGETLAW
jgi:hypothetical protein